MYAHIDCNNFFASCERLFRPDLENKPVAVLSNNDGCIIARSAEVKALGISMGMPLFEARTLVRAHDVTLFSANFELYGDMSERIVSALRGAAPRIEVYSIDESFLDLTQLDIPNLHIWAKNVQEMIRRQVGVPVSVGIGPTKTLAKIATNYAKKHSGVAVVDSNTMRRTVLEGLPVEDTWGIGRRTAPKLRERGVTNAWQLVSASDGWLRQYFTITGMRMVQELRGVSCLRFGDARTRRQSIMVSRGFGHKVRAYYQLESATASFATRAVARLRAQNSVCAKVVVYLTTGKQDVRTRNVSKSVRLPEATADTGKIIAAALGILEDLYDSDFSYHKVAVLLLDIVDREAWQLSLTDPVLKRDKRERLMNDVDRLNHRYGQGTVWHAAENKPHVAWQSKHALRSPRYTTSWHDLPRVIV